MTMPNSVTKIRDATLAEHNGMCDHPRVSKPDWESCICRMQCFDQFDQVRCAAFHDCKRELIVDRKGPGPLAAKVFPEVKAHCPFPCVVCPILWNALWWFFLKDLIGTV